MKRSKRSGLRRMTRLEGGRVFGQRGRVHSGHIGRRLLKLLSGSDERETDYCLLKVYCV